MSAAESGTVVLRDVEGWPMAFLDGAQQPRLHDLELASRLGYAKPHDIRELIGRMVEAGRLDPEEVFRTVRKTSPTGGRPGFDHYLSEEAALLVTTQSETPKAWELTRTIIRVFRLALRGELPAQAPEHPSARRALPDLAQRAGVEGDWWLAHRLYGVLAAGTPSPKKGKKGQLDLFDDKPAFEFGELENFLAAAAVGAKNGTLIEGTHYAGIDGKLCVRVLAAMDALKGALGAKVDLEASLGQIRQLARTRPYVVTVSALKPIAGDRRRCLVLDAHLAPEGLDLAWPIKAEKTWGGPREPRHLTIVKGGDA